MVIMKKDAEFWGKDAGNREREAEWESRAYCNGDNWRRKQKQRSKLK